MADAIAARYAEDQGQWPRSIVMDLWGSQTIRTGGEEMGTALALLGVSPVWDAQSFRVTGSQIVPMPKLTRPRAGPRSSLPDGCWAQKISVTALSTARVTSADFELAPPGREQGTDLALQQLLQIR
jgi:CobN/Magnesium Chelatase